jgi:hypothetical protein
VNHTDFKDFSDSENQKEGCPTTVNLACSVTLYTEQKHMSHLRRDIKVCTEVKGNNDEEYHLHDHNHSRTLTAVLLKLEYMYSTVSMCVDLDIEYWPFVVSHFNTNVLTFCDWLRQIRMLPCG